MKNTTTNEETTDKQEPKIIKVKSVYLNVISLSINNLFFLILFPKTEE